MTKPDRNTVDDEADRVARIALTWMVEPGDRLLWSLVQSHGAPGALERLLHGDAPDIALRGSAQAQAGVMTPARLAEMALTRAERTGARLVVPTDPEWPGRVDELATLDSSATGRSGQGTRPPLCLWIRGSAPLEETLRRSVAVVGARAATSYGLHVTSDIAYGLAQHDWTVVAGGGHGVEAAAHRAALTAGGRTVVVLSGGVDRPYPAGNPSLFEQIAETGLLISAYPPGDEPLRHRFLSRNRLIAATTVGTVLTEAAMRSGSIQVVTSALGLGRHAMVVPGPVSSVMSVGCHDLLRRYPRAAALVTGLPHVLETLDGTDQRTPDQGGLDPEAAVVLAAVPRHGTTSPQEMATQTGLPLRTVLRRLSQLEGAGLVERHETGVSLANPAGS